jgi:hypothetical protein
LKKTSHKIYAEKPKITLIFSLFETKIETFIFQKSIMWMMSLRHSP